MGTSLKEKVLRVVSNSRVPLSTREIAEMLGEPVEEVYKACLELEKEGELETVTE